MKTIFPKLPYKKKNKMIMAEFKKNKYDKKGLMTSIRGIKRKLDALRKNENDLLWDLDIYLDLLMLNMLTEAKKSGFKEKAKVIFLRDNSHHSINVIYFDKELMQVCVNLYPPPKVNYFNKTESPITLSHIKLDENKSK